MTAVFIYVLNMSITASYIAIAVILIRFFLKKAPKIFSYILWAAVWIRLVCPVSFTSAVSFLNIVKPEVQTDPRILTYVPYDIGAMQNPGIDTGIDAVNKTINASLPQAVQTASVNPMQALMSVLTILWVAGMVLMIIYSVVMYLKIVSNVKTATLIRDNIFESDRVNTPFICGFLKPKICLPVYLNEQEFSYVVAHEQIHFRRKDYIIKLLAFIALTIHWFNPLAWVSFSLMCKDMEMSCDERVIKQKKDIKYSYTSSLLSLAVKRSGLPMGSPLAFGENGIKTRIKNILNYKKPAVWMITLSIILTAALLIVFTSNPTKAKVPSSTDPTVYSGYNVEVLLNNKTSYVGDNSKVVALIDAMSLPNGFTRGKVELKTSAAPYEATINLKMQDASSVKVQGSISGDAFYRNAIVLFSLVHNVDVINVKIADQTGQYNGVTYSFTYLRENVEQLVGCDVRQFAATKEQLETLIDKISAMTFTQKPVSMVEPASALASDEQRIEQDLAAIMSSPKTSSNPSDYIRAHQDKYQDILKLGDKALNYMLDQFGKSNNNNDLRGNIMMMLCKELLGNRNNVTEEGLSPQDWFSKLLPYPETSLPDFKADVSDPIEQLVYDSAIKKYSRPEDGFTIVAPTIFGSVEEGNQLKIFATVYCSRYKLYGKTLTETGGCIVPAAITFQKNNNGNYELKEYKEPIDGTYFTKTIRAFCTMPVSGKTIEGMYDKILNDYGNNDNRSLLLNQNIKEHLVSNNQLGVMLKTADNKLIPVS